MASISNCATLPLRPACDVDCLERSVGSACASCVWSQSQYRWNPYDQFCPKALITPVADSSPSMVSPIHFHLELAVASLAFPLPVEYPPWTESSESLHATGDFRHPTDSPLHGSEDATTDDSTPAVPAQVIEYRSYGIKLTKSSAAYREYMRHAPLFSTRTATDPTTPRPAVRCSRKQWTRQMKLWRQALENYRY